MMSLKSPRSNQFSVNKADLSAYTILPYISILCGVQGSVSFAVSEFVLEKDSLYFHKASRLPCLLSAG